MNNWTTEFPDYTNMPPIPPEWTDISWHNDACPSFACFSEHQVPQTLHIFVDYEEPTDRETGSNSKRFAAINPDEQTSLFETDDWQEMLAFVRNCTRPVPS